MRPFHIFVLAILSVSQTALSFPFEDSARSIAKQTRSTDEPSILRTLFARVNQNGPTPRQKIVRGPLTITPIKQIGSGGVGTVWKGLFQEGKQTDDVAIKFVPNYKQAANGAHLQGQLHSNNIAWVEFNGYFDKSTLMIVYEYCSYGDLKEQDLEQYWNPKTNKNYDQNMRAALQGMAQGVKSCHDSNIYHHDIKLENFLYKGLQGNFQNNIKLTDFDFAEYIPKGQKKESSKGCGDAATMSPELQDLFHGKVAHYDPEKNDVWMLGIAVLELITERDAVSHKTTVEATIAAAKALFDPIVKETDQKRPALIQSKFNTLSMDVCKLLAQVFVSEGERITAARFLQQLQDTKIVQSFRSSESSTKSPRLRKKANANPQAVKPQGNLDTKQMVCVGQPNPPH